MEIKVLCKYKDVFLLRFYKELVFIVYKDNCF